MNSQELKHLQATAKRIRISTIDTIGFLGVGHIGGAMSIVDLLTVLYERHIKCDPSNPKMADRDKLVVSKGHAGPALYATLANKGFFPKEWLHTLNKGGTNLPSHCDINKTPGVDMTTGSLGQGISTAIGLAMAARLDGLNRKIFLVIGDGESDEGQIWEGAMAAAHFKLNNLIAFTDYNKMQIDGYTKDIMDIGEVDDKWRSFGWFVVRVDGHNYEALDAAIELAKCQTDRPSMIVMDTIKGKGCNFAEARLDNHNMTFDYEKAKSAIKALEEQV